MGKLSKLSSILFVFCLLVLPLTACKPWEGAMILILKVDAPRDGRTVTTSPITVSGHLGGTGSAAATVRVNEADVPVKGSKFFTRITLTEGTNVIKVVATTGAVTQSQTVTVIYAPTK